MNRNGNKQFCDEKYQRKSWRDRNRNKLENRLGCGNIMSY